MNSIDENASSETVSSLSNLPISELKNYLNSAQNELNLAAAEVARIKTEIAKRCCPLLERTRDAAQKKDGVIHFEVEGVPLKSTISKRVNWDQSELNRIAKEIKERGFNPDDFIETKLVVPERKYQAWTKAQQNIFAPARELRLGEEKIEFIEKEEDTHVN